MLKSSIEKKSILASLILLLFVFSYLREFTFEAINSYIKGGYSPLETSLNFFSTDSLNKFKWILICFTFILFALLTTLLIKIIFDNVLYTKLTFWTFIAFFISSAIFICLGLIIGDFKFGYTIARALMDFTQTPFLFLLLFAVFKVFPKQ